MKKRMAIARGLEGYNTNNFPQRFKKIFEEWFNVIHDYNKYAEDDCLYWYGEIANVSAFGAALARNGYTYLQEYGDTKTRENGDSEITTLNGRVDLWFHDKKENFVLEAKHRFLPCYDKEKIYLPVESLLKEAEKDVTKTAHTERGNSTFFALTFVVPKISCMLLRRGNISYEEQLTTIVEQFIEYIDEDTYCDFWAYCAPQKNRTLWTIPADGHKYYYPMCLLLAKRVEEFT